MTGKPHKLPWFRGCAPLSGAAAQFVCPGHIRSLILTLILLAATPCVRAQSNCDVIAWCYSNAQRELITDVLPTEVEPQKWRLVDHAPGGSQQSSDIDERYVVHSKDILYAPYVQLAGALGGSFVVRGLIPKSGFTVVTHAQFSGTDKQIMPLFSLAPISDRNGVIASAAILPPFLVPGMPEDYGAVEIGRHIYKSTGDDMTAPKSAYFTKIWDPDLFASKWYTIAVTFLPDGKTRVDTFWHDERSVSGLVWEAGLLEYGLPFKGYPVSPDGKQQPGEVNYYDLEYFNMGSMPDLAKIYGVTMQPLYISRWEIFRRPLTPNELVAVAATDFNEEGTIGAPLPIDVTALPCNTGRNWSRTVKSVVTLCGDKFSLYPNIDADNWRTMPSTTK